MANYKKYLHVERLGTEECEGLLDNETVYVTAKVDGSNGCVFWNEESGEVRAGSRNFVLTDEEDNAFSTIGSKAMQRKRVCSGRIASGTPGASCTVSGWAATSSSGRSRPTTKWRRAH